jgi:hypothetical protein
VTLSVKALSISLHRIDILGRKRVLQNVLGKAISSLNAMTSIKKMGQELSLGQLYDVHF